MPEYVYHEYSKDGVCLRNHTHIDGGIVTRGTHDFPSAVSNRSAVPAPEDFRYFQCAGFCDIIIVSIFDFCDVPSLVKACVITNKRFKDCALISLKHHCGIFK